MRLHPEIIGTAGRIGALRKLLATMRAHGDGYIARRSRRTQSHRHVCRQHGTYASGIIPLGDPRRPLGDAQLLAKYRSLADDVIGSDAAVALAHAVLNIEECADVKVLEPLLVGRADWNGKEIS
jgi:hypothetical protein